MKEQHLVLVGAGHAHLTTIANLESVIALGTKVTVISLGSYQYYSGMGPGLLSGFYAPGEVRFNVRAMSQRHGATFIEGRVDGIDPDGKSLRLSDGSVIPYDVASFNVGSMIDTRELGFPQSSFIVPVKPIERLFETRCALNEMLRERDVYVVVLGGGAAGVEIAANAAALSSSPVGEAKNGTENIARVTLITRGEILRQFPERVRNYTRKKFSNLGIRLLEHTTVRECNESSMQVGSGETIEFDRLFVATGTRPPDLFEKSKLAIGRSKGLLVGPQLSSIDYPDVFGGGDCIDFEPRPLAKVGVYAVRENMLLLQNIAAALAGKPQGMGIFHPQRNYHLILNYGDGTGLSYRTPFMLPGRLAFRMKDHIDRKFMRKFQECGERLETVHCPEQ